LDSAISLTHIFTSQLREARQREELERRDAEIRRLREELRMADTVRKVDEVRAISEIIPIQGQRHCKKSEGAKISFLGAFSPCFM
jgi:hypothetical protein